MNDRPQWFAPKRYGLGCGLPCSWQGWAILTGYMTIVVGSSITFEKKPAVILAIVLPLTALLLIITARTTRGGWRWRWGEKS
jgi:hypothetical protein